MKRKIAVEEPRVQASLRWSPLTLIAFRFCFVYLGLFALATQVLGSLLLIPYVSFRGLGPLWPMRSITEWIGTNVLRLQEPVVYAGNGETIFFWVQSLWLFVLAIVVTAVWSIADRRSANYETLHRWFRVFVRLALASQMFEYGITKIIPVQFASPSLALLVTPLGNVSLETLMWSAIGASPAYQIFTGCVELLGGILLLLPRTTLPGAMICLAATTHVFVLNMTYDIALKLVSFHLILLSAFLLAPDFPRLAGLFRGRSVEASSEPAMRRWMRVTQIVLGIYLIGIQTFANWTFWHTSGGGSPRSPLYGIWNVEQLSIDGQIRPVSLNDYDRQWRRVIFDAPDNITFQRIDDSFARYGATINAYDNSLVLTKGNSRTWKAGFTYRRPAEDQLLLEGEMDNHKIRAQLQLVNADSLRLLNSGFRWVRREN